MKVYQQGYIALTSVLIILTVVLAASVTITYTSIGEAQSGFALFKGEENMHFVEGCTEDYLLKIRSDPNYVAQPVTRPEGTCSLTITSRGPDWDITTTSVATTYQRSIRTTFNLTATGIRILTWNEV